MRKITAERKADQWIDEIIQCAKVEKGGKKSIDKHYLEVIAEIRKDIINKLCKTI